MTFPRPRPRSATLRKPSPAAPSRSPAAQPATLAPRLARIGAAGCKPRISVDEQRNAAPPGHGNLPVRATNRVSRSLRAEFMHAKRLAARPPSARDPASTARRLCRSRQGGRPDPVVGGHRGAGQIGSGSKVRAAALGREARCTVTRVARMSGGLNRCGSAESRGCQNLRGPFPGSVWRCPWTETVGLTLWATDLKRW
jgi:hypothetical protein